jgi:hypothetical protein
MEDTTNVLNIKCAYCGSTHRMEDTTAFSCLDCGMGKYKKGKHKGAR